MLYILYKTSQHQLPKLWLMGVFSLHGSPCAAAATLDRQSQKGRRFSCSPGPRPIAKSWRVSLADAGGQKGKEVPMQPRSIAKIRRDGSLKNTQLYKYSRVTWLRDPPASRYCGVMLGLVVLKIPGRHSDTPSFKIYVGRHF